jgi:hypothetical protein
MRSICAVLAAANFSGSQDFEDGLRKKTGSGVSENSAPREGTKRAPLNACKREKSRPRPSLRPALYHPNPLHDLPPYPHLRPALIVCLLSFLYIYTAKMMSSPCAARSRLQEPTPDIFSSSSPMSTATGSRKQKRPPPITPKRFTRFFTPRNTKEPSSRVAATRSSRKLQDITRSANNQNVTAPRTTPRKTVNFADVENEIRTPSSSSRKRKTAYLSPETSPAQSSPSKRSRYITPEPFEIFEDGPIPSASPIFPAPVRRLRSLGGASRTLQRSFGGILSVGRGFRRDHCTSWQEQTADFYSNADDVHELSQRATPFCTASCNSKW